MSIRLDNRPAIYRAVTPAAQEPKDFALFTEAVKHAKTDRNGYVRNLLSSEVAFWVNEPDVLD